VIRIVLADDADDIRRLVRFVLDRDERFSVVGEAADGAQALELVEAERPDLLLLDLAMPNVDGLEVLEDLRHRVDGPVVVVLSGFTNAEAVNEALALGASSFVSKGESITDLPNVLAAAVAPPAGSQPPTPG